MPGHILLIIYVTVMGAKVQNNIDISKESGRNYKIKGRFLKYFFFVFVDYIEFR